jgi:hypothetical protein
MVQAIYNPVKGFDMICERSDERTASRFAEVGLTIPFVRKRQKASAILRL